MTSGIIVYLANGKKIPDDFDPEAAVLRQGLDPEWTEVAAALPGYPDVGQALLHLAQKGARPVEAVPAWYDRDRGLRFGERRYRLLG